MLVQPIEALPTMDGQGALNGHKAFCWWGVAQCFLASHLTLPLCTLVPEAGFPLSGLALLWSFGLLEQSQLLQAWCSQACEPCAWPCPSSLCSTCVFLQVPCSGLAPGWGSWLWAAWPLSRGQRHAPCFKDRHEVAVRPQALLLNYAPSPPYTRVPRPRIGMPIHSWPLSIHGSHLSDGPAPCQCHSMIPRASPHALDRLPSALFIKEPLCLHKPPSTWFPGEAAVLHNQSLHCVFSVCQALLQMFHTNYLPKPSYIPVRQVLSQSISQMRKLKLPEFLSLGNRQ